MNHIKIVFIRAPITMNGSDLLNLLLKKSAPYVENWVISRIKFADDKKVGVLEYHTLAFCASLRRNDDKDNGRNNDNDSV